MWDKILSLRPGRVKVKPVKVPGSAAVMYMLHIDPVGNQTASNWMIGGYQEQTNLTGRLRKNLACQLFVSSHHVRFGMRKSDHPPQYKFGKFKKGGYGQSVEGEHANKNFAKMRKISLSPAANSENENSKNRKGDREQNIKDYWSRQIPQAHHIVEFNHLEALGVSSSDKGAGGPMDHKQLPCVLLAAELHQLYVGKILGATRDWDEDELKKSLGKEYKALYSGPVLKPLWSVAKVILQAADVKTPR